MNQASDSILLEKLLRSATNVENHVIERSRQLVELESPSHDKRAVNRAVNHTAELCEHIGGQVQLHEHSDFGNSLQARFGTSIAAEPVLVLGHLDTVWDTGSLQSMPWRTEGDRIYGPGLLDMKMGVAMALEAVEMLQALDALTRPVVLLLHGDEEVGSPRSRSLTESIGRKSAAVFVLEPAQGEAGAYKTRRKGVGNYRVAVRGVAAHSGVDFERGHSAILELGRLLGKLAALSDPGRGVTVNPGLIGGGSRSNVVAADAWAEVDVRIAHAEDASLIENKLRLLAPEDNSCLVSLSGGINRPPMERSPAIAKLFERAKSLAAEINIPLEEAATGGGSDGNFTAALGIPTLDGMGAVGAGAHASHEHVLRSHIAPRTALLAAMLR